jgi:ribonuclease HII
MDLLVLILILLSGYIIKYLIDTINTLNNEIREIKMKCISAKSDVQFDTPPTATTAKTASAASVSASAASPVANVANDVLIKNITYFKDYFDKQ